MYSEEYTLYENAKYLYITREKYVLDLHITFHDLSFSLVFIKHFDNSYSCTHLGLTSYVSGKTIYTKEQIDSHQLFILSEKNLMSK